MLSSLSLVVNNPIIKKLLSSSLWNAIANVLVKVNFLILTLLCSHVLSVDDFGRFALILSTIMSFQIFASMGLSTTASKFVSTTIGTKNEEETLSSISLSLIVFTLFTSIILFLSSDYLSSEFLNDITLSYYIKVSILALVFSALKSLLTGSLQGANKFKVTSKCNMLSLIISVPIFAFMLYEYGLLGSVIGLVVIEFSAAILLLHKAILNKCVCFKFNRVTRKSLNKILAFTLPISVSGMLIMPINWFLLKEISVNYSYLEVGVVNILNQWQAILVFLPLSVGTVMLPMFSKSRNTKSIYAKTASYIFLFSAIIGAIFAVSSKKILSVYGSEYSSVLNVTLSCVFFMCIVIIPINNQVVNYTLTLNKPKFLMYSNILWCVLTISLFECFLGKFDVLTLYYLVRFLSYFSSTFLMYYLLNRAREM